MAVELQDQESPEVSDLQTQLAAYFTALQLTQPAAEYAQHLLATHDFSSARAAMVLSLPGIYTGEHRVVASFLIAQTHAQPHHQ